MTQKVILISDKAKESELLSVFIRAEFNLETEILQLAPQAHNGTKHGIFEQGIFIADTTRENFESSIVWLQENARQGTWMFLVPFGDYTMFSEAMEAGAEEVLFKPVGPSRLKLSLKNLLYRCTLEKELERSGVVVEMPTFFSHTRQRVQQS